MASPATGAVLGGKPSCWHSGSPRGMCCRAANWVAISGAAQSLMAEAEPCVRSAAASPLPGEGRRARSTPGAASSTATRLQGCACPPARGVCVLSVCLAERCSPCRAVRCRSLWGHAVALGQCAWGWGLRVPMAPPAPTAVPGSPDSPGFYPSCSFFAVWAPLQASSHARHISQHLQQLGRGSRLTPTLPHAGHTAR